MYFESEFASVKWNEEAGVVVLTWKKFTKGENFEIPCLKALELAIEKKTKKWYSDTTDAGIFRERERDWFNEKIVTKMLQHGINNSALIMPKSMLTQLSLRQAADEAEKSGLHIEYFSSSGDALAWLKSL